MSLTADRRRWEVAAGLCALITICGCHRTPPPAPAPDPSSMQEFLAEVRKCTGRIVVPAQRLACVLPEFGGATIDKAGVLNVFLTDMGVVPRATRIMQYELELNRRSQLQFRFVRGDFSYRELQSIAQQLAPDLAKARVASVMVDEWVNRLRIGFVTEEARLSIEAAIIRLKLPRKAILLEKGSYPQVLQRYDRRRRVTSFDG